MWQGNWPPPHLSARPFRPCRAEFLPPHRLGGAHKRDALYSSHRAPFRNPVAVVASDHSPVVGSGFPCSAKPRWAPPLLR